MNDICFDLAGAQPARQPEAVSASLESNDHARDLSAGLDGFVTPAMQQLEQGLLVGHASFFSGSRCDTRNHSADQPSRQTEFDHGNKRVF